MFSGIVEQTGRLVAKHQRGETLTLSFQTQEWEKPLKRGESIAVNGVCLTVVKIPTGKRFSATVVPATLAQTNLGKLHMKDRVNLERSLAWGDRISGHFVLGHVDGVGRVLKRKTLGKSLVIKIGVPDRLLEFIVPKGSIAVDGVSLTIQELAPNAVTVAVIPHTAKVTTIGSLEPGDFVNLESDVIAKHLAKWVNK